MPGPAASASIVLGHAPPLQRGEVITLKRNHRRCGVLTILALGLVVALGLGAGPALAADGCDCHTVEPLTAPAAHTPYVAAVTDCATCHTAWTAPHPDVGSAMVWLSTKDTAAGCGLTGRVGLFPTIPRWLGSFAAVPHPGVAVYFQQRLAGTSEFVDLGQGVTDADGRATFTVTSPAARVIYRAVALGHYGKDRPGADVLWRPSVEMQDVMFTPTLTLRLVGLSRGVLAAGSRLTVRGKVLPVETAGNRVLVRLQRYYRYSSSPRWRTRSEKTCTISATGGCSTAMTVNRVGLYRMRAVFRPQGDWARVRTDCRQFRVRLR
jgi:hypothetical protein